MSSVGTVLLDRESEAFQRHGSQVDGNWALENSASYLCFPTVGD